MISFSPNHWRKIPVEVSEPEEPVEIPVQVVSKVLLELMEYVRDFTQRHGIELGSEGHHVLMDMVDKYPELTDEERKHYMRFLMMECIDTRHEPDDSQSPQL